MILFSNLISYLWALVILSTNAFPSRFLTISDVFPMLKVSERKVPASAAIFGIEKTLAISEKFVAVAAGFGELAGPELVMKNWFSM